MSNYPDNYSFIREAEQVKYEEAIEAAYDLDPIDEVIEDWPDFVETISGAVEDFVRLCLVPHHKLKKESLDLVARAYKEEVENYVERSMNQ